MSGNDSENKNGSEAEAAKNNAEKAAALVKWTKRSAFFLGFCAFIVMFLLTFDFEDYLNTRQLIISTVMSLCAFLLFWVSGLIIGNILLRGLVTDVPVDQGNLIEGGVLQRIYLYQQRLNYDSDGNVIHIDPRTDTVVRGGPKNNKK